MNSSRFSEDSFSTDEMVDPDDLAAGIEGLADILHQRHLANATAPQLRTFPRLPAAPQPLKHNDLRYELEQQVSDGGVRHELELMGRTYSSENELNDDDFTTEKDAGSTSGWDRIKKQFKDYLPTSVFGTSVQSNSESTPKQGQCAWNTVDMILGREMGLGGSNNWTLSQKRGVLCPTQIPAVRKRVIYNKMDFAYTGRFTAEGDLFVAGFQNRHIIVFEPQCNWAIRKEITTPILRWTITDTALSHDGRFLLYSTISPVVHRVQIKGRDSIAHSASNITEIHTQFHTENDERDMYGIWSMDWSRDSKELIVGTNSEGNDIMLYDMEEEYTTASMPGHLLDVGAVRFLDDSCQTFATGSDDGDIKLWDRRIFGTGGRCVGTLVGHLEGITHIDTRGDGRYLLSNSKDQTIKLWDIRKRVSEDEADSCRRLKNSALPHYIWDYRWHEYPASGYVLNHPRDASLATFRGHTVLKTLIRSYFSPQFTTGQRYIYTGCCNGTIRMFDILTGETVQTLQWHRNTVRDCAWHPYEPYLVSTSWDGHIVEWIPKAH